MSYFQRYLNGEYEQVWAELLALRSAIRQKPLYSDAYAVAKETMTRAKHNVELLLKRLTELNYQFVRLEWVYEPVGANSTDVINKLEELAGTLPLSLRVWYEVIGGVYFMGVHSKLSEYFEFGLTETNGAKLDCYSDPLIVEPPYSGFSEFENWDYIVKKEGIDDVGAFCLPIAPDFYHKANVSGGAPYEIELPNANIDTIVKNYTEEITFVQYLREAFKWGGFPGFRFSKNPPKEELEFLTKDLLPI